MRILSTVGTLLGTKAKRQLVLTYVLYWRISTQRVTQGTD